MNLIWQTHVGEGSISDEVRYSSGHFRQYAKQHHCAYMFDIDNYFGYAFDFFPLGRNAHAILAKLRPLYDEKFDEFDKVLVADTDILINDFEHNIFDYANNDVNGVIYTKPPKMILDAVREGIKPENYGEYFGAEGFQCNGGIIVLSKEFRQYARRNFLKPLHNVYEVDEIFYKQHIPDPSQVSYLNCKWNFNARLWRHYPSAYFIHFHGEAKKHMETFYHIHKFELDPELEIPLEG